MSNVLIFDTEATDKDEPELIEAAWLRVAPVSYLTTSSDPIRKPLTFEDQFEQRYKPTKQISFGAMAVHNILPAELHDCPPSDSFFIPYYADYIVGHNIDFDWHVAGEPDIKRICTDAMARYIWQDADSYSQSALLYATCGATPEVRAWLKDAHSALADVYNCARLLDQILLAKPEIETWSALYAYSEACRIPRVMTFGKCKGERLVELPRIDFGYCQWLLDKDWLDPYLRKGIQLALNPPEEINTAINDDEPPF